MEKLRDDDLKEWLRESLLDQGLKSIYFYIVKRIGPCSYYRYPIWIDEEVEHHALLLKNGGYIRHQEGIQMSLFTNKHCVYGGTATGEEKVNWKNAPFDYMELNRLFSESPEDLMKYLLSIVASDLSGNTCLNLSQSTCLCSDLNHSNGWFKKTGVAKLLAVDNSQPRITQDGKFAYFASPSGEIGAATCNKANIPSIPLGYKQNIELQFTPHADWESWGVWSVCNSIMPNAIYWFPLAANPGDESSASKVVCYYKGKVVEKGAGAP